MPTATVPTPAPAPAAVVDVVVMGVMRRRATPEGGLPVPLSETAPGLPKESGERADGGVVPDAAAGELRASVAGSPAVLDEGRVAR